MVVAMRGVGGGAFRVPSNSAREIFPVIQLL